MILLFELSLMHDGIRKPHKLIETRRFRQTKTLKTHCEYVIGKSPYRCRLDGGYVVKIDVKRIMAKELYKLDTSFPARFGNNFKPMIEQIMWWQKIREEK